jgi:hypothetical protein
MACLWPEPPEYREPEQTHPRLWNPSPTDLQILHVSSDERVTISVSLESEDAGEELVAALYLNYGVKGRQSGPLLPRTVSPGTQGHERTIDMAPWMVPNRGTPGTCEPLTLIVTHRTNCDEWLVLLEDNEDVDKVTWWLDINDSEQTLGECGGGSL